VTWNRWRRICGWLALLAGFAWLAKFVLVFVQDGYADSTEALTGFLLPSLGSIAGLVASLGIAVPLVSRQRVVLAGLACVLTGFVCAFCISEISNAIAAVPAISDSNNFAVRTQTAPLVSGLLWCLAAAWMLKRRGAERLARQQHAVSS
jgi:membrane protease YdiL (CAAX protease family)